MEKWKCTVCGYVHEGEMSDDFVCPLCKNDKTFLEEAKRYVCRICGYVHEGEMSDDFVCPLCKKDKTFFDEAK